MIKAVIIDDEEKARETLRILLTSFLSGIEVLGEADSALAGIELVKSVCPELVFLDVEMRGGSGFTFLDSFDVLPFDVIFTTGYEQYAIEAIRHSAVDYLVKPFELSDLKQAIERHLKKRTKGSEDILWLDKSTTGKTRIALPEQQGFKLVEIKDIVFCEASGGYSNIQLHGGEKLLVSRKLKYFEEKLKDHDFCRIHDGFLVNLEWVDSYKHGTESKVILKNGKTIPVSRGRKKNLLNRLKN